MEPDSLCLKVSDLGFSYTHLPLFKNISFQANAGQIIQLTGANGAGKSTCLSILAGFRKATTGRISLDTKVDRTLEEEREYLAAEANSLYYDMDALSNLNFWHELRTGAPLPKPKVVEALKYWGLGKKIVYQDFAVKNFSTGMKRRLALARVHCSIGRVWLLDEPLYGLDLKGVDLFKDLLISHRKNGGITIMISHDTRGFESLIDEQVAIAS